MRPGQRGTATTEMPTEPTGNKPERASKVASLSVSVAGLTHTIDGNLILDDVALDIRGGEFFTLLGPSGCGKTTTLRSIAGLIQPESGTIQIGHRDITRVPSHRRGIGFVHQDYALWPHMTVAQHLEFGLRIKKLPAQEQRERVDWALELVGLTDKRGRKPAQLSGGQQQRVALGRAIALHPQVLLMDEPLSNLDRKLRDEMRAELKRLQRELGTTTIYVTHDRQEALTMSDRLAVLRDGRVLQIGTPREVYEEPVDAFVATFLGDASIIEMKRGQDRRYAAGALWIELDEHDAQRHGDVVTVAVRPEEVKLHAADAAGVVGLPASDTNALGRVLTAEYEGGQIRYHIAVDGQNTSVLALTPAHTLWEPGSAVGVSLGRFRVLGDGR
jgi:putative spermidine/putrescine transport system ATP-binding protein